MTWMLHRFLDDEELTDTLAKSVSKALQAGISARGKATLAVSGGTTPIRLFSKLATVPLNWKQVTVTLVDERWVGEDHPDSNAALVKNTLLQDQAADATFLALTTTDTSPFLAEAEVGQRLQSLELPLDVVILGMGDDGHTASFFPEAKALERALHPEGQMRCCAIAPPLAMHERMTLTLPVILNTRNLILYLLGDTKWQVLQKAMKPGDTDQLPVRAVLHQARQPLQIYFA